MHFKAPDTHLLSPGLVTGTLAASCQGEKGHGCVWPHMPTGRARACLLSIPTSGSRDHSQFFRTSPTQASPGDVPRSLPSSSFCSRVWVASIGVQKRKERWGFVT